MSFKKKKLKLVVEEPTPAERAQAAIDQAVEFLTPYVHSAQDYASKSAEKVGPVALAAAKSAAGTAAEAASKAQKFVQPRLDDARQAASPYTDRAKAKVNDDLVPRLAALLQEAEKHPAVKEASKRSVATWAAVKGDVEVRDTAPQKKKRAGKTIAGLLAATALLAAAAVAARKFLTSKDSGWTAHEPSTGYVPGNRATSAETKADETFADETTAAAATFTSVTEDEAAAAAFDADAAFAPEPEADEATDSGDAADSATAPAEAVDGEAATSYGEGSFVGENPPEGYTIKGNERSMKFHLPESGGYERTIADVWFVSAEAAEEAGFTRAQR